MVTFGKLMRAFHRIKCLVVSRTMDLLPLYYTFHVQKRTRFAESFSASKLRYEVHRRLCKSMGKNVIIKQGVFIKEPQNIEIGSNVSIQEYCLLSGYGGLKIGNHVSIAAGTYVFTSSHPYSDKSINFRDGTLEKRPVVIGSNVWSGAGCRILGELAIGDNVIIGAGSVVTKDLPSNGVYAGVPATQIKEL